jgi:site-specific recombinase XerD
MREVEGVATSTIRWRLATLSSLYKRLVRHHHALRNPVGEVEPPAINRDEGVTAAFSKAQARKLLDAGRGHDRKRSVNTPGQAAARSSAAGFQCQGSRSAIWRAG